VLGFRGRDDRAQQGEKQGKRAEERPHELPPAKFKIETSANEAVIAHVPNSKIHRGKRPPHTHILPSTISAAADGTPTANHGTSGDGTEFPSPKTVRTP
jgi:hypothetical protein